MLAARLGGPPPSQWCVRGAAWPWAVAWRVVCPSQQMEGCVSISADEAPGRRCGRSTPLAPQTGPRARSGLRCPHPGPCLCAYRPDWENIDKGQASWSPELRPRASSDTRAAKPTVPRVSRWALGKDRLPSLGNGHSRTGTPPSLRRMWAWPRGPVPTPSASPGSVAAAKTQGAGSLSACSRFPSSAHWLS